MGSTVGAVSAVMRSLHPCVELCVAGKMHDITFQMSHLVFICPPIRTQNPSPADGVDSEDFPLDFTLHLDPPSQDGLTCSPATAVELHRDAQSGHHSSPARSDCCGVCSQCVQCRSHSSARCSPGSMRSSVKPPEEAVVDEEAILSLLESSQTFLPASQTSHHSSLLGAEHTRTPSRLRLSCRPPTVLASLGRRGSSQLR